MKYRNDIQGLRAIAVLLVIFSHVGIAGFAGGWIGVDVFFVISGFLITGLLIREYDSTHHVSLLQFYIRRAKRILPASLVTILVVLIASNLLLNSIRNANINTDAIWAVGFVSNIHFININTDYFTSGQAVSPLQHFWSLAVEEQFYLIWPALFLLISRQHGLRIRSWSILRSQRVLLVAVIASALSLMWSISYTNSNPTSAYFSTLTRVWELGFGVLLACTIPQIQRLTERLTDKTRRVTFAITSWTGLAAIILGACVIIKPGDPFPGYLALIPVLGAVGLIFGGLAEKQPIPNRILSMQPLPFIGLISFSLYLWHWPVHVFADALYPDSANTAVGIVAQLVVILAISLASYYLIENTTRHLPVGKKETTPKKRAEISKVPTAAIAVMCVSAAFLFIVSDGQAKNRSSDAVMTMETSDAVEITTDESNPIPTEIPVETISRREPDIALSEWNQQLIDSTSLTSVTPELSTAIQRSQTGKVANRCVKSGAYCWLGSRNPTGTVALLGDSHAEMIMASIAEIFPSWRVKSYAYSACPTSILDSLPGNVASKSTRDLEACNQLNNERIADVLENPPDVVVISDSLTAFSSDDFIDTWSKGQSTTYEMLAGLPESTRIMQLTTTPGLARNGWESCLTVGNSLSKCFANPSGAFAIRDAQEALVAKFPRIALIDILPLLCDGTTCPPAINGVPVYIEGNHFSEEFRLAIAPAIGALMAKQAPELKPMIQI